MDILLSDQGFAIPLAILCTAIVLLTPSLEAPPRRAMARRRSYAVAAIMPCSSFVMIGLIYLIVRFVFD
ncbi:hypothetical protein [Paraburkholderia sacchari]|uniref:Uncharacterized protein n=1 Tax=Paraburkholderia sacchari TaxID=159450 RepID=A0A8T6ZH77_9BURK|nr:hypothetical protein [Paraburkholderia sacchari]NLP64108.1 hypothetical protein [Paraburkholderia sacchari]